MRSLLATLITASMLSPLAQGLSLEQSVATAIDTNPDIQQQYARYQSVLNDRRASKSDYLPQVSIYGGLGKEDTQYNSGQEFDTRLDRTELGLSVSQMLFNGFRTQADVKRLSLEAESERLALLSDAENLTLEVCRIYLELLKADETVELSKRNVLDHQKVLDDVNERMTKGLSSRSDYAQISSRLATARASLASAQNNQFDLQAEFYSQVGVAPRDMHPPRSDTSILPENLQNVIDKALEIHPTVLESKADIAAAEQEFRGAKSNYYPEVSLDFIANKNDNIGGFEGADEDARLMLSFRYDLYQGGRDKARADASGWRYQEAVSIQRRTFKQIEEGAKLSWNARYFLSQQVELYQENVDAATAATAGYQEQFNLGRRSLLDVLDSKIELFLARRNYVSAKYDALLADYRLNNSMGVLLYSLRVGYPEQWQDQD